jgi:O-antigen ligase
MNTIPAGGGGDRTAPRWIPSALFWMLVAYLCLSILVPPPDLIEGIVSVRRPIVGLSHAATFLLAGVTFALLCWRKKCPSRSVAVPVAALLACWTIGTALSVAPRLSAVTLAGLFMRGLIPAWAASIVGEAPRLVRKLVHAIIVIVGICALLGLFEWCRGHGSLFGPDQGLGYRIFSTIGHPLPLSCLLLLAMPLCLSLENKSWRILSFDMMAICLAGTVSRSGWGIALLMLLAIAIVFPRERAFLLKLIGGGVIAMGILLTVWAIHSPASVHQWTKFSSERMSWTTLRHDATRSHRAASYLLTWRMLREFPVWGSGLATFPDRYLAFMTSNISISVPSPDNVYLRIAAETGALGFIAFAVVLFQALRRAYQHARTGGADARLRLLILIGLYSVLLSSIFFDSIYWPSVLVPFCILVGLSQVAWQQASAPIVGRSFRKLY